MTVLSGSLTDALGMRKTLWLGTGLCAASRAVMAFTNVHWLALAFGLFPLAVGEALTGPVLVAGARIFSNTKQRSMSFSLVYMMMNVGFFVAGFTFDYVRKLVGEHGRFAVGGTSLTTYQTLLLVSFLMECTVFPLIFYMRNGAHATDDGVKFDYKQSASPDKNVTKSAWRTLSDTAKETGRVFAKLWANTGFFFRLISFLVLIAFLKLILMQIYYVFPEFGIRMLGAGAPVGRLSAINPIIVIVLVPIVGALTQRFSAYSMVILGGAISAASVFIMVLPPAWWGTDIWA
jgi:proton-dependent oligopeptide transporter, POT family